jgi:putative transposase
MINMVRPVQVRLKLKPKLQTQCTNLAIEAAKVWNTVKIFHFRTYRKKKIWLSEASLKHFSLLSKFPLHSQTIQAIVERFVANCATARELRKKDPTARFPYKTKHFFVVHWKKSAIKVKGRKITLSNGKGRAPLSLTLPSSLADCKPNCIELIWRNGYWLSITMEVPEKLHVQGNQVVAADLGEIHAITLTSGGEAVVISGRQLRSVKHYRNKSIGKIQRKLARCKKGSKRYCKLKRALSRVSAKCHRQVKDLNHKITHEAVNWCVEHETHTLVIGDVSGIGQNTKQQNRLNQTNRQKISQWEHYKHKEYLKYQCAEVGIEIVLEDEANTSKNCPKCGHKHKPSGRNYNCPNCKLKMHRDVVGAVNIRTKHLTGALNGDDNFKSPAVKYLRKRSPCLGDTTKVVVRLTHANVA